jgi:hypothetical protein
MKLHEVPEKYLNISNEKIEEYPYLKESIKTNKSVKTPVHEYRMLRDLFNETRFFNYNDEFYEISFITV